MIFDYIEVLYYRTRRHSALGYKVRSPTNPTPATHHPRRARTIHGRQNEIKLNFVWLLPLSLACALAAKPSPDVIWADWQPLLGNWVAVDANGVPGKPSDGGCSFSLDLQGAVIIRKNHAEYPATNGRPPIVHDDLMMIFHRDDTVRAFYYDGEGHEINYAGSYRAPDKSWTFVSDSVAGVPRYRLTYALASPQELNLKFEIAPPGAPETFETYINATIRRDAAPVTAMPAKP